MAGGLGGLGAGVGAAGLGWAGSFCGYLVMVLGLAGWKLI